MHLWERSRNIAAISVLLIAGAAAPASAEEVEQVANGGFDNGADPFWTNAGMTIGLTDGRACVDVPGGTVNRWDAAVGQNDIDLVAGETYRFSFDASGDAGHVVRAITGLAVSPYDTYFEQSPVLGDWQHYEWTFTANASTAQGQVAFQVGGS
ncbi:carbohydrate binding domain-containing protein, partial [Actinoplanes philippinensis]|uniref:carbohydrate binding domain-containing protein n=1 Tax=Actinoplanes philippinensis TaxID=35752 RepID=UPI0034078F8B